MSELTSCNRCTLEGIKRRAKADGMKVIQMTGTAYRNERGSLPAGVEVYVVPKGVTKKDLRDSLALRSQYGGRWFMELTEGCCC